MSLLIFIAESHDMHPKRVPCSKRRVLLLVILRAKPEESSQVWLLRISSVILSVAKNPVKFDRVILR